LISGYGVSGHGLFKPRGLSIAIATTPRLWYAATAISQHPLIANRAFMAFFISHLVSVCLGTWTTNSGEQGFVDTGIFFVGLTEASAAWGDYDNDGDLDLVISGFDTLSKARTILYRNDGNNKFTLVSSGLPDLARGSLAWGDYDNDGNLDALLIGITSSGQPTTSYVYHNDGGGMFHLATPLLTGDGSTGVSWADFDNDGDLDALSGSLLYRNNGAGKFVFRDGSRDNYFSSSAWADYDNDGNIDALWTGGQRDNGFDISLAIAAKNDGNGNFTCCPVALNGVFGNAVWGDFDNDGNEDILIAGTNRNAHFILT